MELIFERREIDKEEMRGRLQKMKMQKINKKNKVEISKKCSEGNRVRTQRKREEKWTGLFGQGGQRRLFSEGDIEVEA